MSLALWYSALFAITAGVSVLLFWLGAMATGRTARLLQGRTDGPAHLAAELALAGLLIAGGILTIYDPGSKTALLLYGLGAGALVYTLVEAPLHYVRTGLRPVAWIIWITWPFAITAVAARCLG